MARTVVGYGGTTRSGNHASVGLTRPEPTKPASVVSDRDAFVTAGLRGNNLSQLRQKPVPGKGIARQQSITLCGLCALIISDMHGATTLSACQAGPWMGRHLQRRQRGCRHFQCGPAVLVTQLFADDQDTARADRRKVVVKSIDRLPDLMTKVRREHVTA